TAADLDRQIQALKARYSVQVHYRLNPATDFPRHWQEKPISARGEPASLQEASRLLPIVARFLSQHPPCLEEKPDRRLSGGPAGVFRQTLWGHQQCLGDLCPDPRRREPSDRRVPDGPLALRVFQHPVP